MAYSEGRIRTRDPCLRRATLDKFTRRNRSRSQQPNYALTVLAQYNKQSSQSKSGRQRFGRSSVASPGYSPEDRPEAIWANPVRCLTYFPLRLLTEPQARTLAAEYRPPRFQEMTTPEPLARRLVDHEMVQRPPSAQTPSNDRAVLVTQLEPGV